MSITSDDLMEKVADMVKEVAAEVIEPRFEALGEDEIRYKSPGELVTVADEEAECQLRARLAGLVPDAVFVGEEEFSGRPGLAAALGHEWVWLVDPLDGTANFIAGSSHWAVMVALVHAGETRRAWIWQPATRAMYQAEQGAGATRNGTPIRRQQAPPVAAELRGSVLTKFLDAPTGARVEANRHRFRAVGQGTKSAGVDYPMVAEGDQDFVMFWRTLPWDHAPGALLVDESGGCVRRLDGDPYRPGRLGTGLLAAAGPEAWQVGRDTMLGDRPV